MALSSRVPEELRGPPLGEWDDTKLVSLPGGGTMYVPRVFTSVTPAKATEPSPKYLWRGEQGEGSIEIELISWHRAMLLDATEYARIMQMQVQRRGGVVVGGLETLTVNGFATLYGHYAPARGPALEAAHDGAFARILTRDAGLLFVATHPTSAGVDALARAVLATLTNAKTTGIHRSRT